mmetsp:Transcript_4973/g.13183  ORF Transcript_4973/g.13183 Transcript_4973/m.13183 type:complete len:90 (+) Transcript_4973:479-748(+)
MRSSIQKTRDHITTSHPENEEIGMQPITASTANQGNSFHLQHRIQTRIIAWIGIMAHRMMTLTAEAHDLLCDGSGVFPRCAKRNMLSVR